MLEHHVTTAIEGIASACPSLYVPSIDGNINISLIEQTQGGRPSGLIYHRSIESIKDCLYIIQRTWPLVTGDTLWWGLTLLCNNVDGVQFRWNNIQIIQSCGLSIIVAGLGRDRQQQEHYSAFLVPPTRLFLSSASVSLFKFIGSRAQCLLSLCPRRRCHTRRVYHRHRIMVFCVCFVFCLFVG